MMQMSVIQLVIHEPGACLTCCFLAEITSTTGLQLALYVYVLATSIYYLVLANLRFLGVVENAKMLTIDCDYCVEQLKKRTKVQQLNFPTFKINGTFTLSPNKRARTPRETEDATFLLLLRPELDSHRSSLLQSSRERERERERVPTTSFGFNVRNCKIKGSVFYDLIVINHSISRGEAILVASQIPRVVSF
jgi:hypothetical protein